MFSTAEKLSPTQNLTTTGDSMLSLDMKRCFEVMAIKRCCEVTPNTTYSNFQEIMQKCLHNISFVRIKFVLNMTGYDRIKYIQNMLDNSVLQVTNQSLLWKPCTLHKHEIFIHLPYYESENKLFYLYTSFHVI